MFEATNDRRQLKNVLLASAAGFAAMAATSAYADETPAAAPAADPQKWSWVVDAGGGVGSGFTAGKIDLLAPVWQDMDSLLFVRLGAGTSNKINSSYNLGLGYRTKIDPEWILGLYAGWDGSQTDFDHHNFNQVALGAELMSVDWDFRVNGYLADNAQKTISNKYALFIHDTRIAILQGQEAAYSGIDGEIGYRVYNTADTDVRLFVGGFWFEHADNATNVSMGRTFDFSYHDLAGPKARAEVNVFDIDELGPQSRLSFQGEIQHDDQRGTTGFVGATLRIPLDVVSGAGAQALDDLDRRMIDPVRRSDNVLTQWDYNKPEPVIMYGDHMRSQPTNTLLYVDNTAGTGSYADPTTLHDSTTRTTKNGDTYENSFIVITDKQGDIVVNSAADIGNMQSGQSLVGGGETFSVVGANSGALFSHNFAPGTSDPTIEVYNDYTPVYMDHTDHDTVYGFSIEGYFYDAVHGVSVDHVNISEMTIDGRYGGTDYNIGYGDVYGKYGIVLTQFDSGNLHAYMFGDTVNDVTTDGVLIRTGMGVGEVANQYIDIIDLTVEYAGRDGVNIDSFAGYDGGGAIYQYVTIDNAFVDFVGNNGIEASAFSYDDGYVRQDVSIHDSGVYNAGNDGIYFYAGAINGGETVQNTLVDPTFVNENDYGIVVYGYAGPGGTVYQDVRLTDVNASYNYDDNINISAYAKDGSVFQSAFLTNVDANYSYVGRGLALSGDAEDYGLVVQGMQVDGLNAYKNQYDNININAFAKYGGEVIQTVGMYNVEAYGSYDGHGLGQFATAKYHGTVYQSVYANQINLNHNYSDNVEVSGFAKYDGYVGQGLELRNASMNYSVDGNGLFMIGSTNEGKYGTGDAGTVIQHLSLYNVSANYNGGGDFDGVLVEGYAYGYHTNAVVAQYINISYIDTNDNFDGISINTKAAGFYAATFSDSTISYAKSDDNNDDGAQFVTTALFGGSAQQNARIFNSEFDENYGNGIEATADSAYVGFAAQYLKVVGTHADDNYDNGLAIAGIAYTGGLVEQGAYISHSKFDDNSQNGILQVATAKGYVIGSSIYYSNVNQTVLSYYTEADYNSGNGWEINDFALLGAGITQLTYIDEGNMSYNGDNGFYDKQVAYVGASVYSDLYIVFSNANENTNDGIAMVTIDSSGGFSGYMLDHTLIYGTDANDNGYNGFTNVAVALGQYSFNRQYITIAYSKFDDNGNNGAAFYGYQNFGLGSFGVAGQYVTIAGSYFDYNSNNGLAMYAEATNTQGRVEQHFKIYGSSFYENDNNGVYIYANAHDGTYTGPGYSCDYVQGLTGGCAFVRQTVAIYGSDISDNGSNGIELVQNADNYGAIYTYGGRPNYTPTLLVVGTTVDNNGGDGLHIETNVGDSSYLYEYVVAVSSHFDGNAGFGIYADNYMYTGFFNGPSQSIQLITLLGSYEYGPTTVNDNNAGGISIYTYTYGGYWTNSAAVNVLTLYDTDVSFNGGDGVFMKMNSYGTGYAVQAAAAYYSRVSYNDGDGVHMIQAGYRDLNDTQVFFSVYSSFDGNFGYGARMHQDTYSTFDTAYQGFYAFASSFDGNFKSGAYVNSFSDDDNYALQHVVALYSDFSFNYYGVGLGAGFNSYYDAVAGQSVYSRGNYFIDNKYVGLGVGMTDHGSTGASQQVVSVYDYAAGSKYAGVAVYADFTNSYIAEQLVAVDGGLMKYNGTGIAIAGNFDNVDYGYSTQFVVGNLVKYSEYDGISIHEQISAYNADLYNYTYVGQNSVKYSGGRGISIDMVAQDDGYLWNDSYYGYAAVVVNNNYVSNSGYHGIEVHLEASFGGEITGVNNGTFDTVINGNTVINSAYDGILVASNNYDATIFMGTVIGLGGANYVYNSGGYGIQVATGNVFGYTYSGSVIANNHVEDSFLGGISINNYEFDGKTVSHNLIIDNYSTGSVTFAGIEVVDTGYFGSIYSKTDIYNNDVTFNYVGIGVYAYGDAGVFQYDVILGNTVVGNLYGIYGLNGLLGDSSGQKVNVYSQNFMFFNGTDYLFNANSSGYWNVF